MHSNLFVGLRDLVATFCVHVHAFSTSVGLLSLSDSLVRGSGPLAGKSGVADVFVGLFELLTLLCMCACVRVRRVHLVPGPFWLPHVQFCGSRR